MDIRVATKDDAAEIQQIYALYVKNTAVTFEYDVPSIDEFAKRIENTLKGYPFLVAVEDKKIAGYAYAGSFHSREAYKHCAEVSVYVHKDWRGNGIGKALYEELEKILIKQNVFILYACVAVTERENDEHLTDDSVRFHQSQGYTIVGKHNLCGYKFGKWYSVIWMEKVIAKRTNKPKAFVPLDNI